MAQNHGTPGSITEDVLKKEPDERWRRALRDVAGVLATSKVQRVGAKAIACRVPLPRREEGVVITNPRRMELIG